VNAIGFKSAGLIPVLYCKEPRFAQGSIATRDQENAPDMNLSACASCLSRCARIFHLYWRLVRGMTLGVRGVVLDAREKCS